MACSGSKAPHLPYVYFASSLRVPSRKRAVLTGSMRSASARRDGESDLANITQASFTAWISALLVVRSSSVRWRKRGAS